MKKTRTVVIAFLTALAIIMSVIYGCALTDYNTLYGDLDGDNIITAADALTVLRYSVDLEDYSDEQFLLSDVDGDGNLTAADALDILRYSVNLTVETKVGKNCYYNEDFLHEDFLQDSDTTTDSNTDTEESKDTDSLFPKEDDDMIYVHIGANTLEVKLSDNSSAKAFRALLEEGNLTVEMHDYGNFEKVGSIGTDLPRNDEYITTEPGDLILYQGNQITIYYDVNSWDFTRIGKVQGLSQQELREILGSSDVTAVFSVGA